MAKKPTHFIYWDSCVFLSWIEKDPDRYDTLRMLLQQIDTSNGKILTSNLSIAEVAYVAQEKEQNVLSMDVEKRLNDLWGNPLIQLVDTTKFIMERARRLMRRAMSSGLSLKPPDAIHLATAEFVHTKAPTRVKEFHTYDKKLVRYGADIKITVSQPHVENVQRRFHINRHPPPRD